jgi:hypothetical protein
VLRDYLDSAMSQAFLCYHDLHNSLLRIRRAFSSSARPVARDVDLLAGDAYLVAAHAAVEHFFEDLCRRAIYKSLWRYRNTQTVSSILDSLVETRYKVAIGALPRSEFVAPPTQVDELRGAVGWMVKRIDGNQGVKKSNLLALLLPVGFAEGDFDPVWLASMDSFGLLRGDTAHGRPSSSFGRQSVNLAAHSTQAVHVSVWSQSATRTRTTYAPWDVDQIVAALLPEMAAWDRRLQARS